MNVISNDFSLGNYFIDDKKFRELKSFEVHPGDILITCSGTIGKIAEVPKGSLPGIINQALLRIRLNKEIVDTKYFIYLFESRINEILLHGTRGSAMKNLTSVRKLKELLWPIAPVKKQREVVINLDKMLEKLILINQNTINTSGHADTLEQSILAKAYRRELIHPFNEVNQEDN